MKTRLSTLSNGLRVASCEMPHAESVALGLWVNVGGRHEPEKLNGISHFIEHLLFKGTKKRSARRIMTDIEGIGGEINAYTSEEHTCYYAIAPAQHFRTVASVLCDLYTDPKFAAADIELERAVIAEEIQMVCDEPAQLVQELLNLRFWKNHSLGRPLTGTLKSIAQFSREDFLQYRTLHYHAANTLFTAAGRVRHEELLEMAEHWLAHLPKGKNLLQRKPRILTGEIVVEKRDLLQTHIALALPSENLHSSRRYALAVLNTILGGNGSSRLFQELRERRGICYAVNSHLLLLSDCGMLNISLGLDLKNIHRSLEIIRKQFQDLKERPVGASEFRRAQEYLIGTSLMSLERTSSRNSALGSSILSYGRIIDPSEVHAKVRAVTPHDVLELANQLLCIEKVTLAAVGPLSESFHFNELA
ncbi:MAG: peptidase M16 [Verrucomicrobia bacterium]|nr:MAG: peptidase M16 [Verrucomicrobiota bacterium]